MQGERPCQFPKCGELFTPPNPRSSAKYCPKHTGGRVTNTPTEPQPDLSAEQLERLSGFLRERVPLLPIPPKIFATRIEDMGFDTPQEGVALFSDLHYYSQIDRRVTGICEYNIDIARDRMARWRDGLLRFTQMNQLWVPLDTLHIFALGDELEGHGRMFPTQALQMSESLLFQVMGFVEDMTDVLISFLRRYKKVVIYKVVGNHGRTAERARDSYGPDNAELFAWEIIAERIRGACGGTWQETADGVHALTGGSIDFHLHRSFLAKVDILGWRCVGRHGHGIRGLDATYCLNPEVLVLTRDLRWVKAGDLRRGDKIIGFSEESTGRYRIFQEATIVHAERRELPVYQIVLSTGEIFYATAEHRWLVRGPSNGPHYWQRTDEMADELNGAPRHPGSRRIYYLPQFVLPTTPSDTRTAGFLAGAFDADGCLKVTARGRVSVGFAQQPNALLDAVREGLKAFGFCWHEQIRPTPKGDKIICYLGIKGGLKETIRFLTLFRPPRLLSRWQQLSLSTQKLKSTQMVQVLSVRPVGEREVAAITSTSGTYLSAGYGSHNTGALDNKLRLNSVLGEIIHYYFKGHLHERQSAESEIGGEVIQNGSFVGPSLLTLERSRAAATLPSQEFMLFHPRYGKTHQHTIHLATAEEVRQVRWIGEEKE